MDILASNTRHASCCSSTLARASRQSADPVAWINANPGRIKSMHCKDLGAGAADTRRCSVKATCRGKIFEAAEKTGGIECYLVEQEAGPADEQLQRSEKCLANFKKLKV